MPSLPTMIATGPRKSASRAVSGGIAVGADDPQAPHVEVGERLRQVVDGGEAQVLDGARRGLDRRRRERRLVVGREDRPVDARGLGRPQQGADVLGILERVEHEHERRLAALAGEGEDVVGRRPLAKPDHERDALVPVEAGDLRQRPALDLDDRDPQARRVEHELLERPAALGDDEQPARLAAGDERLLDGAPARDELLVLGEGQRRGERLGRPERHRRVRTDGRPGRAVERRVRTIRRRRAATRGPWWRPGGPGR